MTTGKLKSLTPVFKSSTKKATSAGGVYNTEFKFVSEKYAVLSDGLGYLMILETGDRQKRDEWKRLGESLQPLDGTGFIIQDAKFAIDSGDKIIHCLLLHIDQVDGKFLNIIDWITLKQGEGKSWEETARRTMQGKGSLYYLSLDPRCMSIVYSSNHEYKYTLDTVNEIVVEEEPPVSILASEDLQQESESTFKWKQNGEDVTINFKTNPEATKDQFTVNCLQSHVEVKFVEEVLMNSDLFADIDTELTTWTLEYDFMQLNLVKRDADLIWPYLIPGGPPMDSDGAQLDLLGNAPISDLNSQMEECDFGGQQDDEIFLGELFFCLFLHLFHEIFLLRTSRRNNAPNVPQNLSRLKSSNFHHNSSTRFPAGCCNSQRR